MKIKTIVTGGIILAGTLLLGHQAAVAGIDGTVCVECHTMHNSQDGLSMTSPTGAGAATEANEFLLLFDCLQCHTRAGDGSDYLTAQSAPAVSHTSPPTPGVGGNYLAGGSFYYVESVGDGYGHNVDMLPTNFADDVLGNTPPGDTAVGGMGGFQLSCIGNAGNSLAGCHLGGGHHNNAGSNDTVPAQKVVSVDGTTVGDSYRFLSGSVQGGEHWNWEWSDTDENKHNVYKSSGTWNSVANGSITAMCANCHGDFHGSQDNAGDIGVAGGSSPWIRHPTDLSLVSATSGVNTEHDSYGTYSVQVPIGTDDDFVAGGSNVDMTGAMAGTYSALNSGTMEFVLCQSCHRAHGSQHLDMLRFTYANMEAGTKTAAIVGTGCFKCHSQKDGV